jgi:Ca-activated chloride channel family protein
VSRRVAAAALLLAAVLAAALRAQAGPGPTAGPVTVSIVNPRPGDFVYGTVTVAAQVQAAGPVARVEIEVDGRRVATLTAAPWRTDVDLGEENVAHRFRVTAWTAAGVSGTAEVETPPIAVDEKMNVELQQLYVTVTDGSGRRVLDLDRGDFRIVDDGREQQLVTFERGEVPLAAVLLLDSSESMRGVRLQAALRGAQAFAADIKELDEAMLVLFSDRILHATPFTGSGQVLTAGLRDVEAAGGTAVNDHLYLALKLLDARQGRRVVVLFSDGADVVSALRMRDVLWKARRSQALVYWIRLEQAGSARTSFSSSWRGHEANRVEARELEEAVVESGGRVETLAGVDAIEPAFRGILAELREQFVLGYYPTDSRNDGSWREVQVRARGGGLRVRTREGYVDY